MAIVRREADRRARVLVWASVAVVLWGVGMPVPWRADASTCGDADDNGRVTVTDGVNVLRASAGLPSPCTLACCDADQNGRVSLTDGVGTLRRAASLPSVCDGPAATATPTVAPSPGAPLAFVEVESGGGLGAATGVVVTGDGALVVIGGTGAGDASMGVEASFVRDAAAGTLTFAGAAAPSGCTAPTLALAASADGAHVYAAHASCLELLFPVGAAGALGGTVTPMNGGGAFDATGGRVVGDLLVVTPEGRHVYTLKSAAGALATAIQCYIRDEDQGDLFFVEPFDHQDTPPGASGPVPRARADIAVSPDGASVYALARRGPFDATTASAAIVESWRRSVASGFLTFVADAENGVAGSGYADARALVVSGDGKHAYVGTGDGAIATFARNAGSSALTFVASRSDLVGGAVVDLAASADGTRIYAASGDVVVALDRNATTGALAVAGSVGDVEGLVDVRALAVSPDGRHVYAATAGGAIVVLAAN